MRSNRKVLGTIRDRNAQLLAELSVKLRTTYVQRSGRDWTGSPFAWILTRPSRQRGKIGEQLVANWCIARGLHVMRSPDSEADRVIEGYRVEIKFSTLWEKGFYKFQQLRDQNYDFVVCLGISPFDAHGWIFQKNDIPFQQLEHQHGGAKGRDTWWITIRPDDPPAWLRNQSGRLIDVYRVLRGARHGR